MIIIRDALRSLQRFYGILGCEWGNVFAGRLLNLGQRSRHHDRIPDLLGFEVTVRVVEQDGICERKKS